MKLACVVVLFNPKVDNIKNIIGYSILFDHVYIIDNTENPTEHPEFRQKSNIEYIQLFENKGLGYALNLGCQKAYRTDGFEYVVTMDQDSILKYNRFKEYSESILKLEKAAIVSPQYEIDRKKKIVLEDKIVSVDWCMQSASVFNLSILDKLGYFDEQMFIDCIDYDYCLKAKKNGYFVYQNKNYSIYHEPGITKKAKIFHYKYGYCSPLRIYYQSRNLRELYARYKYFKIKIILYMKLLKILLFFDNKKIFLKEYKNGKKDFKNKKFGKTR